MNPNLKNLKGVGACEFCGSSSHVFTKETCPRYIDQMNFEKRAFLSAIDQMGYSEIEFLEAIQKGKIGSIVDWGETNDHIFGVREIMAVKNYIKLHTKD